MPLTAEQAKIAARRHQKFTAARGGIGFAHQEVEKLGGAEWAKHFFPYLFTRDFTFYQKDFWQWVDEIEPFEYYRPRIECEPRGVGKSTNAEAAVVKLIATKKRKMIGYVSLDDDKATKHFESIKNMMESDKFQKAYPHCSPKVQKLRNTAAQWSRDAIVTESGAMVVPLTLLGSSRGWKSAEGVRFDMLILDDIDKLGQSPEVIKKLLELLKGEILAAGDDNTVVVMPQNLIHRDSICAQIRDHRADILSDRIFCGAYPLLKWYDAEKQDLPDGAKKWIITAGEPLDNAVPLAYAEKLLNKFGKATFDRECQQKVDEVDEENDFREWNERFHLITQSEFRRVFEASREPVWNKDTNRLQIPARWNVGIGFDWGTTVKHPAVVTFVARPGANCPLQGYHFVFAEIVMPKFPQIQHETSEIVSVGRVATAIKNKLAEWNVSDSQVKYRLMSHEASATLNTMAVDLPEDTKQYFQKWKAQKGSGVPQIQESLAVDVKKPHPFRYYPQGYKINQIDVGGQKLKGSPRIFFVVADNQGELNVDLNGELFVNGATDAAGFSRARYEMPLYNHRNQGQKKIDDDFVDAFRGLMARFGVSADPLTDTEVVESEIAKQSPALTYEAMAERSPYPNSFTPGQQAARRELEAKVRKDLEMPNETLNALNGGGSFDDGEFDFGFGGY